MLVTFACEGSEEGGVVGIYVVHTGQNGLLVLPEWTSVEQGREASVRVVEDGPFLLLAEVESFFGLEYLRGVGLLGLRGGDTWWRGETALSASSVTDGSVQILKLGTYTSIYTYTMYTR